MNSNEIIDNLEITDLENIFDVYEDERGFYRFNLNSTIYVNSSNLQDYALTTNAFWPLVSYKLYGTTKLAWLLMKLNGVDGRNLLDMLKAGDTVKYMTKEDVETLLKMILK